MAMNPAQIGMFICINITVSYSHSGCSGVRIRHSQGPKLEKVLYT